MDKPTKTYLYFTQKGPPWVVGQGLVLDGGVGGLGCVQWWRGPTVPSWTGPGRPRSDEGFEGGEGVCGGKVRGVEEGERE